MKAPGRRAKALHDIRNRLAVARANIEAFIDGKLAPDADRLRAVLQSLDQLEGLLEDLREGPSDVDQRVRMEEINVCSLLTREYAAAEVIAKKSGVTLNVKRCAVPTEECAHFFGDPVRIGEIVSNVLLNAVRYTPRGGMVSVDCSRNTGQLQVAIADTGPGIAPDETERIFKAGVRGSASRGTPGSGYGLAIAKEFVEAQGGTIQVSASAAGGARFVVRLPGTAISPSSGSTACTLCVAGNGARKPPAL